MTAAAERRDLPLVSVVMPVLCPHPRFFPEAVASVLGQTHANLELVIVEDPSEQSAGALLARFDDARVRHIVNPARTSLLAQRNRCLAEARGAYVAQLDADDVAHPERVARQLAFLEGHSDVDVVGTHLEIIDEAGNTRGYRYYPESHDDIVRTMRRYNPIANPGVMFRRDVVLEAGGYQFEGGVAEDYDLYCRLALRGARFATYPAHLLRYRIHGTGTKAATLRQHLRNTIDIKRRYWRERMTPRDHARLAAERAMLHLPPWLVLALFHRLGYRKHPRAERPAYGSGVPRGGSA